MISKKCKELVCTERDEIAERVENTWSEKNSWTQSCRNHKSNGEIAIAREMTQSPSRIAMEIVYPRSYCSDTMLKYTPEAMKTEK